MVRWLVDPEHSAKNNLPEPCGNLGRRLDRRVAPSRRSCSRLIRVNEEARGRGLRGSGVHEVCGVVSPALISGCDLRRFPAVQWQSRQFPPYAKARILR